MFIKSSIEKRPALFSAINHLAALKAPDAKPSRERAECEIVIVSTSLSKITSCMPGIEPTRYDERCNTFGSIFSC